MSAFQPIRDLLDLNHRLPYANRQQLIAAATTMLAIDGISRVLSTHPTRSLLHTVAHTIFDLILIEHLLCPDERLEAGLRRKYPDLCRGCNNRICTCSPQARPDPGHEPSGVVQLPDSQTPASAEAWRTFLHRIYPNTGMPREVLAARLASEVGEVIAVAHDVACDRSRRELSIELADVFAWTCALGNQAPVTMESGTFAYQHATWETRLKDTLRLP